MHGPKISHFHFYRVRISWKEKSLLSIRAYILKTDLYISVTNNAIISALALSLSIFYLVTYNNNAKTYKREEGHSRDD